MASFFPRGREKTIPPIPFPTGSSVFMCWLAMARVSCIHERNSKTKRLSFPLRPRRFLLLLSPLVHLLYHPFLVLASHCPPIWNLRNPGFPSSCFDPSRSDACRRARAVLSPTMPFVRPWNQDGKRSFCLSCARMPDPHGSWTNQGPDPVSETGSDHAFEDARTCRVVASRRTG